MSDARTVDRGPQAPLPAVTSLSSQELAERIAAFGYPAFHGKQVRDAVLRRGLRSFAAMTDLPLPLRTLLEEILRPLAATVADEKRSRDGTVKLLLRLADGEAVETVVIPEGRRVTACVSTEVGCPVRCAFCASGLLGLRRPLRPHEIVEQVLLASDAAMASRGVAVNRLVLMGMGEPLLNYDATVAALDAIMDPTGPGLGARRITLSTVGIVDAMDRLAAERRTINLAVSLHAPDDETRTRIIPLNSRYGVRSVIDASIRYAAATHRDVTFEYVLLAGVNDSDAQAYLLAKLAGRSHFNVNLIPFNSVDGTGFRCPSQERIDSFQRILIDRGIPCHIRRRRGEDIDAACGQLRLEDTRKRGGRGSSPETGNTA
jgi:23S rRNA (adenine2503-C2)-methyltransferase